LSTTWPRTPLTGARQREDAELHGNDGTGRSHCEAAARTGTHNEADFDPRGFRTMASLSFERRRATTTGCTRTFRHATARTTAVANGELGGDARLRRSAWRGGCEGRRAEGKRFRRISSGL